MYSSKKKNAGIGLLLSIFLAATLSQSVWAQAHNHDSMSHGGMDMKAMMKGMNDQMANMPMSGDPDVDFARMMRIHHVGAVDMAKAQLRDGKNPQMRKMAQDIIAAQNKEIAIFDKFLASKGQATPKK